jgi:hypothetical protein
VQPSVLLWDLSWEPQSVHLSVRQLAWRWEHPSVLLLVKPWEHQ